MAPEHSEGSGLDRFLTWSNIIRAGGALAISSIVALVLRRNGHNPQDQSIAWEELVLMPPTAEEHAGEVDKPKRLC